MHVSSKGDGMFQVKDRVIIGNQFKGTIVSISGDPKNPTYTIELDEPVQGQTRMTAWAFDMRVFDNF
jgi:hypothetical protein